MSNIRSLLISRKAEVSSKIEPLKSEVSQLRSALQNKQAALVELQTELEEIEIALASVSGAKPKITIMDAVMEVLHEHPEGMTALEILAEINVRHFGDLARTSLSPQLSRLKDRDKRITLHGNVWFALPAEPMLFPAKK